MQIKMEVPSLHICHSHYASLPSVYPLHFLFLVITIFMSCLAPPSSACFFKCGDNVFLYPFGGVNSGCGYPALQLECDRDVNMALINICGYQYYLRYSPDLWLQKHVLHIFDKNMWNERCDPSFSNLTTEIWSSPQFHVTEEYRNITLWECPPHTIEEDLVSPLPCNQNWYINMTKDLSFINKCTSQVNFLVRGESLQTPVPEDFPHAGFQIECYPNETCVDCEINGGFCAYETNSKQIYCNCTGSTNPKCPSGVADSSTPKSARSIILGGVIGTAALLVMGALLLFLIRKRCLPTSSQNPDLSKVEKFLQDYVHQMPCRYSYSHLMKITNKFAHKVGEGGFGVVYKGELPTGELVAVKMLDQSRRCENQFMNEVATIGRIHHVHLVRLMGYFYEERRNALVYEYMANGSLDEFIFGEREKEAILNWAQLYSIALGAARGIAYLHQDCDNRIIHFDIKPHNILLDMDFTPKIADFGLAKLYGRGEDHISMTAARGTPGYAAPEVWNRNLGAVTDKSDVYSFGMVLLEMVGGRKNIDVQVSRSSQLYFPEWEFKLMENGELESGLRGSGKAEIECGEKEKAIRLAKVGMWCIQYNSRDRPSMSRVVQMLEGNGDDVGNPHQPFNSSIRAAPSIHSSEESSV